MINCHGSSTIKGDAAEATYIRKMFYNKDIHYDLEALKKYDTKMIKEDSLNTGDLRRAPITATKGNHGHL